jgi:hypothetical protein
VIDVPIVGDSGQYYRRSVVPLDGDNAAHLTETR